MKPGREMAPAELAFLSPVATFGKQAFGMTSAAVFLMLTGIRPLFGDSLSAHLLWP